MEYLNEEDPFKRLVVEAVVSAAQKHLDVLNTNLAVRIAQKTWGK